MSFLRTCSADRARPGRL